MASYAESSASFAHRAKEVQLTDAHIQALRDHAVRTFNHLAFSVCSQPGQIDAQKFQDMVDAVFPAGASLGLVASPRQLAYESLTVAVAAIKQRIETTEEGTVRKLPAHERDERQRRQSRRISGLIIAGDYEPAHSVVDAFVAMLEESVLKILPLSKCISREQELAQAKMDRQIVVIENHQLQVKPKTLVGEASLSNELRVHNAMIRRGLAMDQAGLMTFSLHDKTMREFLSHLTRQHPARFKGPDIQSILRADQELWVRCAEACKSELRLRADGKLPLQMNTTCRLQWSFTYYLCQQGVVPRVVVQGLPLQSKRPRRRRRRRRTTREPRSLRP